MLAADCWKPMSAATASRCFTVGFGSGICCWGWYLLLGLVFALALTFAADAALWPLFYGFVGCACGVLLRDIGWVRAIRKNWPFSDKVTDWEKVRRMAEGTEPGASEP